MARTIVVGGHTVDGNCSKYVLLDSASLRRNEMMIMALVVPTKIIDVTGKLEIILRQFAPQQRGKINGSWRSHCGW